MKSICFVGLGTMGFPMASHLVTKTNHDIYVYNRSESKEQEFILNVGGTSLRKLNKKEGAFDLLILCLKDDDAILDILFNQGFINYLKSDATIIDHSTTSLNLVEQVTTNEDITNKGLSFLDAPVSGGEAGAVNGTLTTMVGGDLSALNNLEEILSTYAKSIVHIGKNGHGQIAKMVNQICIAGILQGLAEALEFGKSQNVDMQNIIKAISGGAAQSWQLDNRALTMLKDEFNFGFAIDLMIKDLEIIKKTQTSDSVSLNLTLDVLSKYQALSENGMGKLDTSALIKSLQS
ncbi:MAG: NAD(P)-dependent oxidoreductase [Proteobacteria bacterium]|nr:NAD(P)-dependent oxidoreductase [Pseudomonadota bacterium]